MQRSLLIFVGSALACFALLHAQEVKSQPGRFDFYVLNVSWGAHFCDNLKTLTPEERAAATPAALQCTAPQTFALHGLWPSNVDDSRPAYCSDRRGPEHPAKNLDITPSIALLAHEWAKHGTCTLLSPNDFFSNGRRLTRNLHIPPSLVNLDRDTTLPADELRSLFLKANPELPAESFAISCPRQELTAVEACFSKDLKPTACKRTPCTGDVHITASTR